MKCFVVVIHDSIYTSCIDASELTDLTAKQISDYLGLIGEILFIKTPLYDEVLPFSCFPLKLFPDLIIDKESPPYVIPPYALSIHSLSEYKTLRLKIDVSSNSEYKIPSFFVAFDLEHYKNMSANDVKIKMEKELDIPLKESSIYIENQCIQDSCNAASLLKTGKTKQLTLKCVFNDTGLNIIKHRGFILDEILTTELSYVNDLSVITTFWEANLRKKKIICEEHLKVLFQDIYAIYSVHDLFCKHLQNCGKEYGSEYALPFIDFIPTFGISQHYVSEYPSIIEILNLYMKNSNTQKKLSQLAKMIDGRDLRSYLITPVQRIPRYILFIRDLIKHTPASHPDAKLLPIISEQIEMMTKQFDLISARSKKQAELMHLQQTISNGFIFLDVQRELVFEANVTIQSSRKTHFGTMYLFTDLILILQKKKSKCKAIYDCKISNYTILYQWPELNSFIIEPNRPYCSNKKITYIITFDSESERIEMLKYMSKLRQKSKLFTNSKFILDWENVDMKEKLIPFVRPKAVSVNDTLYVITKNGKDFELYKLCSQKFIFVTKLPSLVSDFAVIPSTSFIYIFSENNLFKFDSLTNYVTKIKLQGDIITPRKGSSMIGYKKDLIIFGGKSITSSKTYLNDIIIINLENYNVNVIKGTNESPEPRWLHGAILWNKKMILCGGKSHDNLLNDFYLLDLESFKWNRKQVNFLSRKHHTLISFDKYLGVFCGNKKGTQIIDLDTFEASNATEFGNVGGPYSYSQASVSNGNLYVIIGSFDKKSLNPAIFKIQTSLILRPFDAFQNQGIINQTRRKSGHLFTGNQSLDEEMFKGICFNRRPRTKKRSFTRTLRDEKRFRFDTKNIDQSKKNPYVSIHAIRKQSLDVIQLNYIKKKYSFFDNKSNDAQGQNKNIILQDARAYSSENMIKKKNQKIIIPKRIFEIKQQKND